MIKLALSYLFTSGIYSLKTSKRSCFCYLLWMHEVKFRGNISEWHNGVKQLLLVKIIPGYLLSLLKKQKKQKKPKQQQRVRTRTRGSQAIVCNYLLFKRHSYLPDWSLIALNHPTILVRCSGNKASGAGVIIHVSFSGLTIKNWFGSCTMWNEVLTW